MIETPAGGLLAEGDNLSLLAALADQLGEGANLVLTDPPFNTGITRLGKEGSSYEDRFPRGMAGFLEMIWPRLVACRNLLGKRGLLIVHTGVAAQPYLRVALDEIFGPDRLVNDIVWSYRSGGGTKRRLGQKHDHLLVYAKGRDYHFDPEAVRVPYDASIANKRAHLFHPGGKVAGDVWDISRPPNHSSEWTGYPTQKPLALVERLVRAFSREGDLVVDPFCGSGSTLVAAHRSGRRWIGIDQNPEAVAMARRRLETEGAEYVVHSAPLGDS